MFSLSDSIEKLSFLKKKEITALNSLGIENFQDLIYYFPFRYENYSTQKEIASLTAGENATISGKVISIKSSRTWKKRMMITECLVQDHSGNIKVIWYNLASPQSPLRFISKGKYIQISGKTSINKKNELNFQHPNFQLINKLAPQNQENNFSAQTGRLLPIYPENQKTTNYFLRRIIKRILPLVEVPEILPLETLKANKFPSRIDALKKIHFPKNETEAILAKKRFAFEKIFLMQLVFLQTKKSWEKNLAVPIPFKEKSIKELVQSFPFQLTLAQKKAAWQIIKDLEKNHPMNRLLEGDVGSGKTVVAVMALFSVTQKKYQSIILAPTEVLAIQHFQNISRLLEKKIKNIGLLTSSKSLLGAENLTKKELLKKIANGQVSILVATHAALQKKVSFKNLALTIIDEQHRFGVDQRAFLLKKTASINDGEKRTTPHLLTMTATPIPRTLSLAFFGDLDLSIIDEYPQGRKQIITKVVAEEERKSFYTFIEKEVALGRQVFVICPLVEESSKISQVKSVKAEYERLKKDTLAKLRLGILHGRMKSEEKEAIMKKFKNREIDVLISTSVIEVGIDIPNASIIAIEGAERFGLSQLHQLRGRVGRGAHQSYCFLLTSSGVPKTTSRLSAMEKTNDGFKIAQYDLKLRGPGQFFGKNQSGAPDIAMQSLSDLKLIEIARLEAKKILDFDFNLSKFPLLKKEVELIQQKTHWE